MTKNELAQAIYDDLRDKSITQEQLGNELHVTQQAISNWLSGESTPRVARLKKLVAFFGDDSKTADVVNRYGLVEPLPKFVKSGFRPATHRPLKAAEYKPLKVAERIPVDIVKVAPGTPEPPSFPVAEKPHVDNPNAVFINALRRAADDIALASRVLNDAAGQVARALEQLKDK